MGRTIWKGTITFGKVAVPAGIVIAAAREESAFKSLHRDCGTPIEQKRHCSACAIDLEQGSVVKGYEFAAGQYVVFEEGELAEALAAKSIALDRFVALAEVPAVCFDRAHWLVPGEDAYAERAYATLLAALERSGLAGIGRLVLFARELVCLVRPLDGVLALQTLFTAEEIRPPDETRGRLEKTETSAAEIELAVELLAEKTRRFSLARLAGQYPRRLPAIVDAKIAGGGVIAVPEPAGVAPRDLEAALRGSVRKSRAKSPGRSSRRRAVA